MLSSSPQTLRPQLAELVDGLPNISGWEAEVSEVVNHNQPVF